MDKIKLGISACLLGHNVRYDGGHKLDRFLRDTLGQYVDFVPVCPETDCGMGVPREAMRLEGKPVFPRLVTRDTRIDKTDMLLSWARKRIVQLAEEDLCGFIFKSDSPSCGMERVKVFNDRGMPTKIGVGVFARLFRETFPLIPTEEEGRLHDPLIREAFIEQIFTLWRWRAVRHALAKRGALADFHTRHKLLLLSHSPKHYTSLGQLVAGQKNVPLPELLSRYETLLTEALRLKTTPKKHVNVLMHMMGYFKTQLSADEKKELLDMLDRYLKGFFPRLAPLTLLGHYARKYNESYLQGQIYLHPHPLELQLRNHV